MFPLHRCGLQFGSEMVDPRFIPRHNPKQKVIAIFMVTHEMFQADRHALFHVCRGQLSDADTFLYRRMSWMMQSPDVFLEGFLQLIKRYDKRLNVLRTYVEI